MEKLYEIHKRIIESISDTFIRSLYNKIFWDAKLVEITGSRGVGKTTLMLQYIKKNYAENDTSVLYISLDDPYFYTNSLIDTVDTFVKYGGKHLFIDEVHKYIPQFEKSDWSAEIKASYDRYPNLKIVYSGSSIILLYKGNGDLSRRVSPYKLNGLSFREYLEFNNVLGSNIFTLTEVLENHSAIAKNISSKTVILKHFKEYLSKGYYAFCKENPDKYYDRLRNVLATVLEVDIPAVLDIPFSSVDKIKKLLAVISASAPYTPNLSKLAKNIGITDQRTLLNYLTYLEKAEIINSLMSSAKGSRILKKPEKLYLNNTNLNYAIHRNNADIGTVREVFFYNQLSYENELALPKSGDFLVNNKYTFEIGGKNKNTKQILDIENSYIAADEIEIGVFNKIPLWLFGFLS